MAIILRNWHPHGGSLVDYRDIQEQKGYESQAMTGVYACKIASANMTVQIALREMMAKLEDRPVPFTEKSPKPSKRPAEKLI